MRVGDKVTRLPVTIEFPVVTDRGVIKSERRPLPVRVVYIHSAGRYHVVEFDMPGGPVRESFMGVT